MDFEDPISGSKIAAGIAAKFNVLPASQFDRASLNTSEKKLLDRIIMMVRSAESGELRVREHVQLVRDEPPDDDSDEDDEWDCDEEEEAPVKKREITQDMFDAAFDYYRSGKKRKNNNGEGVRTLADMTKHFSWLKTQDQIDQIVKYKRSGTFPKNRTDELKNLADDLNVAVEEILAAGHEFHDVDLRDLALNLNAEKQRWPNFRYMKTTAHGEESPQARRTSTGVQIVDDIVKRQGRKRTPSSTYVCSRCRHHGVISIKKYHTPCPFSTCKCKKCSLFEEKRRIESKLILMKRGEVVKESSKDPTQAIVDDSTDIIQLKESSNDPTEAISDDPAKAISENTTTAIADTSPDIIHEPLSPEAKVILQLIDAIAANPNSFTPPDNFDYKAFTGLFTSPTIVLPEWMIPELPNIYQLVNEAMQRFPNLSKLSVNS